MKISDYINKFNQLSPYAPAIIGPDNKMLTYGQLHTLFGDTNRYLKNRGFGSKDRIASVLPDLFISVCVFLTIPNIATFVPLNPDFTLNELQYYLRLLKINALLLQDGQPIAEMAAQEMNITIIRLPFQNIVQYGLFETNEKKLIHPNPLYRGRREEIALLQYTSGTTSKPKIIPRTHNNLCAAVKNSARAYQLSNNDRLLTIIPIHYTASLLSILASVSVGGCVICAVDAGEPTIFFQRLNEYQPTWFGAGPALLQSIVAYLDNNGLTIKNSSLRFIRSTGAPLSAKLANRLTEIFGIPVVTTYGLTETGIIACNYLTPRGEKESSVGVTAGCEIAIIDEKGIPLPAGSIGEVVVRGSSVLKGYEGDSQANRFTFINGWFRTGDQGRLDLHGYLFITGRIKELINRGGQKVSPYEVEEAVLDHPDIMEAVVFPFPHPKFGEEIAAVVVKKAGAEITLGQLRYFLNEKIAFHKMPTRLFIVDTIPVGSAGKVQRNTLYQQHEKIWDQGSLIQPAPVFISPRNNTEEQLVNIWKDLLNVDTISINDDFFELGGDSLQAACLFTRIEQIWKRKIPLNIIYLEGTIEKLANSLRQEEHEPTSRPFLLPIQKNGNKTPLFCIHSLSGEALEYQKLSLHLGADQPVYGLRFDIKSFKEPPNIQSVATNYIRDIRSVLPEGPYLIIGNSLGGLIAFEIARQLKDTGQKVGLLTLIDTMFHDLKKGRGLNHKLIKMYQEMRQIPKCGIMPFIWRKLSVKITQKSKKLIYQWTPSRYKLKTGAYLGKRMVLRAISANYHPQYLDCEIIFIQPEDYDSLSQASLEKWLRFVRKVLLIKVGGNHTNMMSEPHITQIAAELKKLMEKTDIVSEIRS